MIDYSHQQTTRTFYDTIAADYAERFRNYLDSRPLDRAMLTAFAELVRAGGGGQVAELGCGPGEVTDRLTSLGLSVVGFDLSPAMIALARKSFPELRFEEGSMTELPFPDGGLAAICAWYSIIHTPAEQLPSLFTEFHRLLAPGGPLLLAFQVGEEPLRLVEPFGHPVSLDFRRLLPDRVAELLGQCGFTVQARLVRERETEETAPQAFLIARRTG